MTDPLPEWARATPNLESLHNLPDVPWGGYNKQDVPLPSLPDLGEFVKRFLEKALEQVVMAVVGFFIPGVSSFEQLKDWAENLGAQITSFIYTAAGINLASWDDFVASLADGKGIDLPLLKAGLDFLSALFNGLDFDDLPTAAEAWQLVATVFLAPLNLFAIPDDVQADINAALGNMKDALNGTYTGSGPIFLAIKAAAAQWLTGTSPVITSIQGDATSAQNNWTSWLSGGAWGSVGASVADFLGTKSTANTAATDATTALSDAADAQSAASGAQSTATTAQSQAQGVITQIFNKLGGNNAGSATQSQANAVMLALASTISAQGAAINALQNILEGANGFSASVPFRQPETQVFDVAGNYTPVLPAWFNHATDSADVITVGAGSGGSGGFTDSSTAGTDSVFKVAGVTKATGTGGAAQGPGFGSGFGASPGNLTHLDILYVGGAAASATKDGNPPGGGGGSGEWFSNLGKGGNAGSWDSITLAPGQASGALSLTVGAGGAGINLFNAADGADGCGWLRARPAMPAAFTSMGTLLLPTFRLNTGVALTDAMTAAATWSRVPPGGASGGHILIIRANTGFTTYVYLWVKTVGGVTNYEMGRVSSGVKTVFPGKTGTIAEAVPFNAFSLTSDDGYIYTIAVNGTPFDSYDDTAHGSSMGATYRSGGWASSDSALPGSIIQFAFLDSGTPSRIVSNTVATSQGTSSTSYTDLATTGPSVTLNVPPSGEIVVDFSAYLTTSTNLNVRGYMTFVLSGANTLAASDARAAAGWGVSTGGLVGTIGRPIHLTGLNPGTTTIKAVYKASAATATFSDRHLIVEPKP
ncbi:hypothetical protein AB0876_28655 [Mycobacterium sp. NPDC049093]